MSAPEYWQRAKRQLARRDPTLAGIMRAHPRIALARRGEPFMTLTRAIVGQQISVRAADAVWRRLVASASAVMPETIAKLRMPRLRSCGLSQRKAEYIRDLARHFNTGAIHARDWPGMDDEAIIEELVAVRGIGRWTAEMFLIFNLLRPDVLPVDDLGLRKAVSRHYCEGAACDASRLRELAEPWAPWRSVATWYLWRSLDPRPVEY